MPKCHVCGGSEFIKEEGFLYCSECQTQCKGVSEQVFDSWGGGAQHESKTRISEQHRPAHEEDSWTSWEAYNYVLKGMVDELLELGASPNFKAVVFQLWVRYLQSIDVAFLKSGKKLPKLGANYLERDAQVLYSWPTKSHFKKKKSKGNASDGSSDVSSVTSSRARAKARRAFFRAQHDKESSMGSDMDSSFHSDQLSESSGLSHQPSVRLLLRKNKYMTDEAVNFNKCVKNREKSLKKEPWKNKIMVSKTVPSFLCKVKLLAIIHIGLLICKDDIQLSDLLRWIREGHLSYCSVIHFLPPKMAASGKCVKTLQFKHNWPSHLLVRKVAGSLVDELKIDSLPTPSLTNLIRRYAKELSLPGNLADFAVNIWADCQPEMPIKSDVERGKYSHLRGVCNAIGKELPNYEGRAMSFLLYSLKLLFGLDGFTEENLSKFASEANKILGLSDESNDLASNDSGGLKQKLFVWKEWVKYIEFRSSLISRWNYPLYAAEDTGIFQLNHEKKNVIPKLPPSQSALKYIQFCEFAVESKTTDKYWKKGDKRKLYKGHVDERI
ncbi:TATA box-binding protein-associated factor RNA polymerase I subunit B isoform X2 [Ischnura elegans]|uniref:TATA box-binding protein-associated factor RNA polymerase I subunit B isoform X2 n=1 Tax=Ischnura elegans TaxID=197161 RepID=UPI001ED89BCA|nr:TATA box-binding protein-associated factor RNA polymerase I subunit B isoform X2 [Ischnura elegans]